MDRNNHYEAAFEAYLLHHRLRYIGVDETRRVLHGEEPVKSLDFIVLSRQGLQLMVDVKGRRFPGGKNRKRRVWESWSTRDDVDGLQRWTGTFGANALGVLVFLYELRTGASVPADTVDLWTYRDRRYLLRAVSVDDYCLHMKVRSPKWDTVHLAKDDFAALVRPFRYFTHVHRQIGEGELDDQDSHWSPCDGAGDAVAACTTGDPTA